MITLLNGQRVDPAAITFNSDNYHFTLVGVDITNLITRADKQKYWPDFDPNVDNTRLYNEHRGGTGPVDDLPTNTTGIFLDQIVTDPLAAPADAFSKLADTVKQWSQTPLAAIVITAVAIYVITKVTKK